MNALANSQAKELEGFLGSANDAQVTYARYTGQESNEDRELIKANPPDILLTNFMMLELLMTRQSDLDRKVLQNYIYQIEDLSFSISTANPKKSFCC